MPWTPPQWQSSPQGGLQGRARLLTGSYGPAFGAGEHWFCMQCHLWPAAGSHGSAPWPGPRTGAVGVLPAPQGGVSGMEPLSGVRCGPKPPLWGAGNRHFGSLRPASLRRHMRSAAPFSPQFCTCAPTAERRCPLGSVHAGEQPHRSRSATVSRSERSAQATRPPLAALATDLIASLISRPSASKLSMMDIVDREADAERPRGG